MATSSTARVRASGRRAKRKASSPRKPTLAERADRHALYQAAVQTPEADIAFFEQIYRKRHGRKPLVLREDFCGTAYLSTEWVKSSPRRSAIGVDLDGPTLAWGREHNVLPAGPRVASRVHLVQGDVRTARAPKAEITCAMNFSFCVFKQRRDLAAYFAGAKKGLAPGGMLVLELYGGTEAIVGLEEEREGQGFTYVWEQETYNPITSETVCHISFRFPDRSTLRRAFTYDWRHWSLAELSDLLAEAGFIDVQVFWESVDEDGDGTGLYHPTNCEENQESWLVYVVASRP